MLEVDSILSIGLYKIDLWELELAAVAFEQVIDLTTNTAHYRWGEKASIALALVKSYLGFSEESTLLADVFYEDILINKYTGRFAYFMQILGQTYVNLEQYDKALTILQMTLDFAQESYYKQIKAKTFLSLGEIYRQQEQIERAIAYQLQAINILTEIDAKCDLAEAHFQLALSYQNLQDAAKTNFNRSRSLELFEMIEAEKQVEKIRSRLSI